MTTMEYASQRNGNKVDHAGSRQTMAPVSSSSSRGGLFSDMSWKMLVGGGAALLLAVFLCTSANSTMPTHGTPTLPDHLKGSAFGPELYATAWQEPYISQTCFPARLHLSPAKSTSDATDGCAVTISFSLDYEKCAHVTPIVSYGKQGDVLPSKVTATPDKYRTSFEYTSQTTKQPYQSDWIYHVEMPSLECGVQEYWYRITVYGNSFFRHQLAQTPTYGFYTAPHFHQPTSLALLGDLGQTLNSTSTMANILKESHGQNPGADITMLLIAGDMSYADGEPDRWTSWFDIMEPLFQRVPMVVGPGNHEIECDMLTRDVFVPYEHYFANPNRIAPPDMKPATPDWKSCTTKSDFLGHYNYGNAFFKYSHGMATIIMLNSYTDSRVESTQYKWLAETLPNIDRSATPWLIVAFHAPLFTTFAGHVEEEEAIRMRVAMEPLFAQYYVNFVVSGHDHGYMRTKSIRRLGNDVKAPLWVDPEHTSPVYLTVGEAGNREGHSSKYRHPKPEPWIDRRDRSEFGYGHLRMFNSTHATWNWIRDDVAKFRDRVWFPNSYYLAQEQRQDQEDLLVQEEIL